MKKNIFRIAVTFCIIFLALFGVWPLLTSTFDDRSEQEKVTVLDNIIFLKPVEGLAIVQGFSDQLLTLTNKSSEPIQINIGHSHDHLTLEPHTDILQPGGSRDITIHVDDFCPSGKVDLLLYFLAESETEKFSMEATTLAFEVLPGTLTLAEQDNNLVVTWNENPAPPGVLVFFSDPYDEDETWRLWGETPDLDPPSYLRKGFYTFIFKARLSNVESAIEQLEVYVEREPAFQPFQPRSMLVDPLKTL